jgi:hypothetical protein
VCDRIRFLYPGLALGAILAGGMLAENKAIVKTLRAPAAFFLILAALFDVKTTIAFYESSPIGAIHAFVSKESSEELLNKYVPHSRPAFFVRENLPSDIKMLFVGETQGYYFHRNYMPVSAVDRHPLEEWIKSVRNPAELRILIKSKGFTHILLCRHEWDVMNRTYGYLTLDEQGREVFENMIKELNAVYNDAYYELYAL